MRSDGEIARIVEMRREGKTLAQIGEVFGTTRQNIDALLRGRGLSVSADRRCVICGKLIAKGSLCTEHMGCDKCACGATKKADADECRACYAKRSRAFDHDLAEALYRRGYSTVEIGRFCGVSNHSVYRVLTGRGVRLRQVGGRPAASRNSRPPIEHAAKEIASN
jgi:DNA-binding CsgD family transcriptional regulator